MEKTKSMKKGIIAVAIIMLLTVVFCACVPKLTAEEQYDLLISNELTVTKVTASYVFDDNDISSTMGYVDYVFVGKVIKYKDTTHNSHDEIPRTTYVVKVMENIMGTLVENENIEIVKDGGLAKNYKSKIIINNDIMPLEEEIYIFSATTFSKGGFLDVGGNNSNILISDGANFKNSESYKNVVGRVSQVVKYDRERFVSKFDKNYK